MMNKKIKWETPELINLNNKKVTRGDCGVGLSNIGGFNCQTGPDAIIWCLNGNATLFCNVGGGG